jgi:ribonuclease HI
MKKNQVLKMLNSLRSLAKEEQDGLSSIVDAIDRIKDWVENSSQISTDDNNKNLSVGSYPLPESFNKFHEPVVVFSDGACRGNPGPGAWGVVAQIKSDEFIFQKSGVEFNTTNNKMELTGAIEGLKTVEESLDEFPESDILLVSDSKYVVDGLKSWVSGWKKRGWKKADGKPPENLELWKELDGLNERLGGVHLFWVKGHSGHPQNELCDQLANKALDEVGL